MAPPRTFQPSTRLVAVFRPLSPVLVAVGWIVVVGGAITSAVTHVHYNNCGNPADLPGTAGIYSGGVALALAAVGFGMAMWLHERNAWRYATAVVIAAVLLAAAAVLVAGWVLKAYFIFCG